MIESIPFSQLRADEYFTFSDRIILIGQNHASETSTIHPLLATLVEKKNKLDASLVKSSTKFLTDKVKEKDRKRDDCFVAIRDHAKACSRRPKPEWQEASRIILDTIKKYGWKLYYENYSVESSKIKNMVSDMETIAVLIAALETIGATEWKDDLKTAQAEFDTAVEERMETNSEIALSQTKETCKEVEQACKSIFKYLEVMDEIDPKPEVTTMIDQINEVIREFNNTINIRLGKREAAQLSEN